MCEEQRRPEMNEIRTSDGSVMRSMGIENLLPVARELAGRREFRIPHVGFTAYGHTVAGQKVLIAVDREYDPAVPQAVARALREKGARVDVLTVDLGEPEREFSELDEIEVIMRREPWERNPRRYEGLPFVEDFGARNHYDLVIHGKGAMTIKTPFRYEVIPWLQTEHFLQGATTYPQELHLLINDKIWEVIWERGRGGTARLTDREGTDLTWTYWEDYYEGERWGFTASPRYGHLFGHPAPPLIPRADARGIVAGTTSHFNRPFPRIRLELDGGQIAAIEGGGSYGAAWKELLEESRNTQYPCFPRPGLFYLWEAAIGTNPKIARPSHIHKHRSGGTEWDRRRSGIIHMGFGTLWRASEERWAGERGLLYGHLHVHLLFPTLTVRDKKGREHVVIRDGHLSALDDPQVRALAAESGDPDEVLREAWIPAVPGINSPGSYEEYARDPAAWIYGRQRGPG